tara:strand:+ start:101 stop:373 length:273 start_codon:yes stop_codon:yes gene_type:complete
MIKYFVEFLGTFFFLSIILRIGEAIPIAVGILAAIYFGGSISGGHYNPAVSIMMYLNNTLSAMDLPFYMIAQILGGIVALVMQKYLTKTK